VPADPAGFPAPRPGDPIGQITIPKIGADFYMVEGVDLRWLQDGPGHFPGTPFPGQAGNAALAGHRTTFKAPFNRIDELVPGDTITVTTLQGTFTYKVLPQPGANPGEELGYKIIWPDQLDILDQPPGRNLLTLMACHPKYDLSQRIVVVAELTDTPAPTTAKSPESEAASSTFDPTAVAGGSTGDLVGGSPAATGPALLWGAVAGLVWLAAWLVSRRWSWHQWPKWLTYALALPAFLVPLFLCFGAVNELLPAGY
jgi:sortase A